MTLSRRLGSGASHKGNGLVCYFVLLSSDFLALFDFDSLFSNIVDMILGQLTKWRGCVPIK